MSLLKNPSHPGDILKTLYLKPLAMSVALPQSFEWAFRSLPKWMGIWFCAAHSITSRNSFGSSKASQLQYKLTRRMFSKYSRLIFQVPTATSGPVN